jgi:hypothetical protein
MIRIRTKIGDKRIFTACLGGIWVTIASGLKTKEADSLMQAGINHLESANLLKLKDDFWEDNQ